MDLFAKVEAEGKLRNHPLFGDWASEFSEPELERVENIINHAYSLKKKVYPDRSDVLRMYREVPLKNVKVVIIGQDPYHDGNANGVAFACKLKGSPSLISIVKAMVKDVGTEKGSYDRTLQHLLLQGVFLLNTVLTVEEGSPKSHVGLGWQSFTKETVKIISTKNNKVVFILWGNDAVNNMEPMIDHTKHLVLKAEHPVAAVYNKRDWKCDHFSKTNQYLIQQGKEPIGWI